MSKKKVQLLPREMRGLLCVSYPNETKIWRLPRHQAYSIVEQGGKLHPRNEWRAQRTTSKKAMDELVKVTEEMGGYDVPNPMQRPKGKEAKGKKRSVPTEEQKRYWDSKSQNKKKKR